MHGDHRTKKRVSFSSRTSVQNFLKTRSETNTDSITRRGWDCVNNGFIACNSTLYMRFVALQVKQW